MKHKQNDTGFVVPGGACRESCQHLALAIKNNNSRRRWKMNIGSVIITVFKIRYLKNPIVVSFYNLTWTTSELNSYEKIPIWRLDWFTASEYIDFQLQFYLISSSLTPGNSILSIHFNIPRMLFWTLLHQRLLKNTINYPFSGCGGFKEI